MLRLRLQPRLRLRCIAPFLGRAWIVPGLCLDCALRLRLTYEVEAESEVEIEVNLEVVFAPVLDCAWIDPGLRLYCAWLVPGLCVKV